MIKVTILYPNIRGARFDHDYYERVHIPLAIELLGPALRAVVVERGLTLGPPWPAPAYTAVCAFTCESIDAYQAALLPHLARLQADLANYSDVEAVIQIGAVAVDRDLSL